jgi:hypothetical protein
MKVRFIKKKLVLITNKLFIVYQPLVNAVFNTYNIKYNMKNGLAALT